MSCLVFQSSHDFNKQQFENMERIFECRVVLLVKQAAINFSYFSKIPFQFNEKVQKQILSCSDFYYDAGKSVYSTYFVELQDLITEILSNPNGNSNDSLNEESIMFKVNSTRPKTFKYSLVKKYQDQMVLAYFDKQSSNKNRETFVNDIQSVESHYFLLELVDF